VDESITGGQQPIGGVAGEFARVIVGEGNTVSFINPVTVGGVRDQLYIADAGARAIYRYDLTNKAIKILGQAGGQFVGEPSGLFVEPDLSFYVADPTGKQVLYFDSEGNFVRRYSDLANLSRPVDVVVDPDRNQVYVADGTYSHIVVFSKFGQALFAVGSRGRGPGKFRTITAMARGKDSLFVADRLELPLQEIDMATGTFRYSFGQGQIVWPTAIAVDKEQRLFVSDRSDNTIKVFDDVRLIATIGGTGSAPGRFRLIADMWISDQGLLYVADSMNRRVQVFRVLSESSYQTPAQPN
jgi:DNA-binding beta-propeller fold protein YncE